MNEEKKINGTIKLKESEKLELKKSTSELKEAIISISAILNKHRRGELWFGIRKDGVVTGQTVSEKTLRDISKSISDFIEPRIFPKIVEKIIEGKSCIFVEFEGLEIPYFAYGRAYLRVADEDRQISAKELERMILEKNKEKLRWDGEICKGTKTGDISKDKVNAYLKLREKHRNISSKISVSYNQLLVNIGVLRNECPTNAGILFFGKNPIEFIPRARLRLVRIKGVEIYGNILDRLDCEGTLWEMVEQAEEFLRKNIRLLGFRAEKSFRREDKFDYPIRALREAIINGLIHRNYYNPADMRIMILDDRIEIISPGAFPEGVTPERPEHKPVNEILSILMYDIGFIEKYGSGIYLENKLCEENGNGKPIYDISSNQTKVTFKSQVEEITVVEVDDKMIQKLNERQRYFVWSKLKDISREEYSKLVNCSIRTAFNDLQDLFKKKVIKRKGGGKYVRYIRA